MASDDEQQDFSLEMSLSESMNDGEHGSHDEGAKEDTSQTDSAVEEVSEADVHHQQAQSTTSEIVEMEKSETKSRPAEIINDETEIRSAANSERGSVGRRNSNPENCSKQMTRQTVAQSPQTTTHSNEQHAKKFPHRQGIVWKAGVKLEAMDFMKKWYAAKIVDVDDDECHILIHFEGWNQRYDEWVAMTSERLRPLARHSDRKVRRKKIYSKGHGVGDKVLAKWTDCKMYPAKITSILSDGSYRVIFYDGFKRIVQPINVQLLPEELKQSGQMFEDSPPDPKGLKKMGLKQSIDGREAADTEVKRMVAPIYLTDRKRLKHSRNKEKLLRNKVVGRMKRREQNESIRMRKKRKVDCQLDKRKSSMLTKKKKLIVAGCFFVKRAKKSNADAKDSSHRLPQILEKKEKMASITEKKQASSATEKKQITSVSEKKASTKLQFLPANQPVCSQTTVSVSSQTPMSVPSSPADSSASEKKSKKRTESPAISETSNESFTETPDGGGRRRSRSLDKDKLHAVASKAFVISQDHNPFKCNHEGCDKSFRKESLLIYHIKYYHTESKNQSPPDPPPRKRRKTTSVCSTDSEQSITFRSKEAIKRRHVSADVMLTPMKLEKINCVKTIAEGETMVHQKEATHSKDATHQKDASLKEAKQHTSKHRRTSSQDTIVTEGSVGNDTEEELKKNEVVNCICNTNDENGLMIQCEVCLCWQHASCFDITSEKLPKKYICFVCGNPSGVGDSCRYLYDQDWLKQGELTGFSFLPPQSGKEEQVAMLKAINSLIADMHNIKTVLHGSKCKLKFVKDEEHDEYKLWRKDWAIEMKEEKPDIEQLDNLDDTIPMKAENVSMETTVSETGQDMLTTDMTLDSLVIPMESEVVVASSDLMATPEKDCTEGIVLSDENQSEITTPALPTANANDARTNLTDRIAKCESTSTITSESTLCSVEENSVADLSVDVTKDIKVEDQQAVSVVTFGLEGEEISVESNGAAASQMVHDDPFKDCEQNLLEHILHLQGEINQRLDLVEEQVAMLEAVDSGRPTSENILSDMPQLKRSLKTVQSDLNKVKRMAAFGS